VRDYQDLLLVVLGNAGIGKTSLSFLFIRSLLELGVMVLIYFCLFVSFFLSCCYLDLFICLFVYLFRKFFIVIEMRRLVLHL
jgi:hypothetical protein